MASQDIFFLEGLHVDFNIKNKTLNYLLTLLFNDENDESKICATSDHIDLTFGDLKRRASCVAASLVSYDLVAVCMQPSLELIVTLCGILLRGIAYVPLEPTLPLERIEYILNDSQAQLLIINGASLSVNTPKIVTFSQLLMNVTSTNIEESRKITGEDTFCLMYTSGSTGEPKGVRLPHRALLNRLHWQWLHFPFTENDKCCFKTSISFVDSIAEIFAPLLQRVPIVILPKSLLLDVNRLISVLFEQRISRIVLVPSLLTVLLHYLKNNTIKLHSLRIIVCSGETLSIALIEEFFSLKDSFAPNCLLLNLYGSTEVMADVTYEVFEYTANIQERFTLDDRTSIGYPIENMRVGELVVKGEGVANGYHNVDPSNTKLLNKFTYDTDGKLRFNTGDLGRIWNGRIFLYGRNDTQVTGIFN